MRCTVRDPLAVGLLLAMAQLPSPPGDLPRGRVIDRVACKSSVTQSYALYLPSAYSPDRTWPVLYAFDAGARGASQRRNTALILATSSRGLKGLVM